MNLGDLTRVSNFWPSTTLVGGLYPFLGGVRTTLSVVDLRTETGLDQVFSAVPRLSTPYFSLSNPVSASGNSYQFYIYLLCNYILLSRTFGDRQTYPQFLYKLLSYASRIT